MKAAFKKFRNSYQHFVEKQSFPIIVTICVAVITTTALWTRNTTPTPDLPPMPTSDHVSASRLLQQSLKDAATGAPSSTQAPQMWAPPFEEILVCRPYSATDMVQSGVTGVWALHDAIDLQSDAGAEVRAISDGTVLAVGNDSLRGAWIQIDHGNGVLADYAGLSSLSELTPGDVVALGDALGIIGNGPLDEADLEPHLHLRVTQNGKSIDPATLW